LGLYATRRGGSRARPYRTLLRRIEPLDGSCECADFLRSSLGLCKHLIAVLEDIVSTVYGVKIERESALDGSWCGGEGPSGVGQRQARALYRPSVLDPPFTFEREGVDLKEADVPLDVVPILAVHPSQDGRVFLLAHLPPSGVPGDDEQMNAFLVDQAASE
jgi:hypothetical protein